MAATFSRPSRAGIQPAICATSSKPPAPPWPEESPMKKQALLSLVAVVAIGVVAARAVPVVYKLPEETAAFKPGPNLEAVQANCTGCHSSDYVNTQQRNV